MRILVVSDSHFSIDFEKIYEYEKPEYAIHAGDSQLTNNKLYLFDAYVRGNCDYDAQIPEFEIVELCGYKFFITHGHQYNINFGQSQIIEVAREKGCGVIIHGHTHVVCCEMRDGILILNPGSITQSRCSYRESYMVLDVSTKGITVELKDVRTYETSEIFKFTKE